MLTLLNLQLDEGSIFGIIFAVIFVGAIILSLVFAKKQIETKKKEDEQRYTSHVSSKSAKPASSRSNAKPQPVAKSGISTDYYTISSSLDHKMSSNLDHKMSSSLTDHSHQADHYETYDEISGSLGSVNDEGCAELRGIRLIVNDEAYNVEEGAMDYNLDNVGITMIMGELLEKPKFKKGGRGG